MESFTSMPYNNIESSHIDYKVQARLIRRINYTDEENDYSTYLTLLIIILLDGAVMLKKHKKQESTRIIENLHSLNRCVLRH